jgi:ketosteroid isomerase-like protein
MDQESARAALQHYLDCSAAGDEDRAHEVYLEDAILEFPQSGERFEGIPNIREWRRDYPAKVELEIRRIRGGGDVWTAEVVVSYDGGPRNYGVSILEFRGDKIARETIYYAEAFKAPEWRAQWRAAPPRQPTDGGGP